uniref:Uncharacterized protein n=1 Tax=Ciona intestinalis TaxID=7719 RepID=H2XNN1_CIOIN
MLDNWQVVAQLILNQLILQLHSARPSYHEKVEYRVPSYMPFPEPPLYSCTEQL